MKRNSVWTLSALLALQLVAAVLLTFNYNNQKQGGQNQGRLLALNMEQVDRLVIEESGQPALELVKGEAGWALPGYYGLPVQDGKLAVVLTKLEDLQRDWPVASTDTTAKRFEVSADKFQRKLTLKQGDKALVTLYLGTSPGMRKTHLRLDGENEVYALGVHHHDLPARGQDWVDASLLQVNTAKLSKVEGPDFTLTQADGKWQLDGLAEQEMTDDQAVQNLLSGLRNLRFMEALGTEAKPEYGLEQPALTLKLQGEKGSLDYRFGKPEKADYYVLKSSDQAPYFKIPASQLEQIINLKRASLAKHKPEQPAQATEESAATG